MMVGLLEILQSITSIIEYQLIFVVAVNLREKEVDEPS